ncbi:MAG: hypothetical protein ACYDDN_02680 [Candidatus Desulforudaceae bacterium]
MNRVEITGTAMLDIRIKHKDDGSVDYARIDINGENLEELLASRLGEGIAPSDNGYTDIKSSARIHIIIEPETLDIKVSNSKRELDEPKEER